MAFKRTALVSIVVLGCGMTAGAAWLRERLATIDPFVPPLDISTLFVDSTPATVTIEAGGRYPEWHTTADDLRHAPRCGGACISPTGTPSGPSAPRSS